MWHIKTYHAELKLGLGRAYPRKAAPREQVLAVSLGRSRQHSGTDAGLGNIARGGHRLSEEHVFEVPHFRCAQSGDADPSTGRSHSSVPKNVPTISAMQAMLQYDRNTL
jgi:hypothetical protein